MNRKRQNEFSSDNNINIVKNTQSNININNISNDDEDEISESHLIGENIINLEDSFEDEHIINDNKIQNNFNGNKDFPLILIIIIYLRHLLISIIFKKIFLIFK